MEEIQNAAAALCVTLVISGIFHMLLPSGDWNRYARFGVRLFLLLCLILPFRNGKIAAEWDNTSYQKQIEQSVADMEQLAKEQLLENFTSTLEQEGVSLLLQNKIAVQKIQVTAHIADEQRIDITNIEVVLEAGESNEEISKAQNLIAEEFGLTVQAVTVQKQTGGEGNG
ncbi:MAG: stage III sporulation protein AF [Candidatus Merdivicinus sp.]|jgi:hypothetical protein